MNVNGSLSGVRNFVVIGLEDRRGFSKHNVFIAWEVFEPWKFYTHSKLKLYQQYKKNPKT